MNYIEEAENAIIKAKTLLDDPQITKELKLKKICEWIRIAEVVTNLERVTKQNHP